MSYTFFLAYTLGMLQERNNNSIMKQSLFDKLSNMAEALNQKGKKKKNSENYASGRYEPKSREVKYRNSLLVRVTYLLFFTWYDQLTMIGLSLLTCDWLRKAYFYQKKNQKTRS